MRVSKLHYPTKLVLVNPNYYRIKWDSDGDSSLERQFRDLIFPFWNKDIVLYQFMIPGSKLEIDFINLNKKIAVEVNGEQHFKFNKHFHRNNKLIFLASVKRDEDKENWIKTNGFKFLSLVKKDLDLFSLDYIETNFNISLI